MATLFDVRPDFAGYDIANLPLRNAKELTNGVLAEAVIKEIADEPNAALIKFGHSILFAAKSAVAAFAVSVFVVVVLNAEKEVGGVAARRIVATVQRAQPGGDFALAQNPGDTMCPGGCASESHATVSLLGAAPLPLPAAGLRFSAKASQNVKGPIGYPGHVTAMLTRRRVVGN